jgi:hypothetical protein
MDEHEPTVDDLRVKLCYICREEERHDSALPYSVPHTQTPNLIYPRPTSSTSGLDTPMQMHPSCPRVLSPPLDKDPTARIWSLTGRSQVSPVWRALRI